MCIEEIVALTKMPPKRVKKPAFPWVKPNGLLTSHGRGIVFGLHLAGVSVVDIADMMMMTAAGVRGSIAISEDVVQGVRDATPPRGDTTPSPKKKEIAGRQKKVARLLRKRTRDGEYVINSSRDMQRALLEEEVEVCRATVVNDIHAAGARYKARPRTADMTPDHIRKRKEAAQTLLAPAPEQIIFSDESLFDCNSLQTKQWVREGEAPAPLRTARWSARAHALPNLRSKTLWAHDKKT